MKKLMIFLLLPIMAEANSPTFIVRTTGDFCYAEEFDSVIANVESALQHKANLICQHRQALKKSETRYVQGTCSVKFEADFLCQ